MATLLPPFTIVPPPKILQQTDTAVQIRPFQSSVIGIRSIPARIVEPQSFNAKEFSILQGLDQKLVLMLKVFMYRKSMTPPGD